MKVQEKQIELQRHNEVVMATIDYLLSKEAGTMVYDNVDIVAEVYEKQKLQVTKYYNEDRLDLLQEQFGTLSTKIRNRVDLHYSDYIKEKTGYEINLIADLQKCVDTIIEQNKIQNKEERQDVLRMLQFYERLANENMIDKLKSLLIKDSKEMGKQVATSETINKVKKDNGYVETITISTGGKPKHSEKKEVTSPDGKRRLSVTQWGEGKNSSTYVTIMFPTANGPVYGIDGIRTDVKAFWKDNSTIVIETKKDYMANIRYKQVRSFDDIITIEYIDS